jgi:hypothetical protein
VRARRRRVAWSRWAAIIERMVFGRSSSSKGVVRSFGELENGEGGQLAAHYPSRRAKTAAEHRRVSQSTSTTYSRPHCPFKAADGSEGKLTLRPSSFLRRAAQRRHQDPDEAAEVRKMSSE